MNVTLRVIAGPHSGQEYVFDRHATFIVGRSSQAAFPVPDDRFLSRDHFLIEFNPPVCYFKDMGSTNGTKVNGERVDEAKLRDGDVIAAGKSAFLIIVQDTREQLSPIRCMACRRAADRDVAVSARPGEESIAWLCHRCADHRRQYPNPPEGYWIESRIGGGGMGDVYRARRLDREGFVAIKMMIPATAASSRARDYFRREMGVMKELKHPNIVEFHEMASGFGQFSLIMEYVDGPDAREWLSRLPGPPPASVVAKIGVQLLSALQHAHERGFVHRDIKPSNILLGGKEGDLVVKLSDFGLAKSFRDDAGFSGLTHQGDVGGSSGFISPDHIRDFREVKAPADIYSAGATLYYLLTGHYPFLDFDPLRTNAYAMILEHPPVPLRVHRPDAPEGLDRVLRKSLEKQARDRWKSAAAMEAALRPFAGD